MIATVEGILKERAPDVVVEVGGLGLSLLLPAGDCERLPAVESPVRLWTHLSVREDAWTLFGFLERETRTMFRLLTTVSGIGPKVALGMLSGAPAAEIGSALHRGDEKALVKLPGVGKKSAARLVVELGSKVPVELLGVADADAGSMKPATGVAAGERSAVEEMLASMGVPPMRIAQALDAAAAAEPELVADPVAWVRGALRHLS